MADNEKSEINVLNQKHFEEITKSSIQRTKTGEVIEPLFDYHSIDDYTKLAVKDVISILENESNDKKKSIDIIKEKFQIEEVPEYDQKTSLWKTMMSEYKLGESIQGFKVIQNKDGSKTKIPVIAFTGELDYLDEVIKSLINKIKIMITKK